MPLIQEALPAFEQGCEARAAALLAGQKTNLPKDLFRIWDAGRFAELLASPGADGAFQLLKSWERVGVGAVSIFEQSYPDRLREIYDPPLLLTFRGKPTPELLTRPSVAIVGSRKADYTGCAIAGSIARGLAERGVVVVSGLALGIDAAAHRGALDSGAAGATIAVLGNGLSEIYPRRNERLAGEVLQSGGVLFSQFAPGEPPYPANFLNRNRVIAGLCDATLVIQAAERSGSLSTARAALDAGREVCAIPGDIRNKLYGGSNELIRRGAYLVRSAEDVLELLGDKVAPMPDAGATKPIAVSPLAAKIMSRLAESPDLRQDALIDLATFGELAKALLELELKAMVRRMPGNMLQRI